MHCSRGSILDIADHIRSEISLEVPLSSQSVRETGFSPLKRASLFLSILLLSCNSSSPAPQLSAEKQSVVYGEDNRLDLYAHPDPEWRNLARESIMVMVNRDEIDRRDPSNYRLGGESLGDYYNLCQGERFREQPTPGLCSSTLVDQNLVLTAGHCINSENCGSYSFIFDFFYEAEGQLANIQAEDVYDCEEVVSHHLNHAGIDYALVRLNRDVVGARRPAPVRMGNTPLVEGEELTLIGFPSQIPLKIAGGGEVVQRHSNNLGYFEATVDAFGGNSGSGVFNRERELVGILVRGESDYTSTGSCNIVNVLPQDRQEAEDITYVHRAWESLCEESPEHYPYFCNLPEGEWCAPCQSGDDCAEGFLCRPSPLNPSAKSCTRLCEQGCRSDHFCQEGHCTPEVEPFCSEESVWSRNTCNQMLREEQQCAPNELCIEEACIGIDQGDSCDSAIPIQAVDQSISGRFLLSSNQHQGLCGGDGVEHIYSFSLEDATLFEASSSGLDTVIYLRDECENQENELICNDDNTPPGGLGSYIERNLEAGSYFIFMDTYSLAPGTIQDYELNLAFDFCRDECVENETQCLDNSMLRSCRLIEGCLGWVEESCPEICREGRCIEAFNCEGLEIIEAESQTLSANLSGQRSQLEGSCAGNGPEQLYRFTLESWMEFAAESTGFDTVLYLLQSCEQELSCNDDHEPPGDLGSRLELRLGPGTYEIAVDSYSAGGEFQLNLSFEGSCPHDCEAGAEICEENAVRRCISDAEGCTYWSPPESCGELLCEEGRCLCEESCQPGEGRCLDNVASVCLEGEGSCPYWSPPEECGERSCEGGLCVCKPGCELELSRCEGDSISRCEERDGCSYWSEPSSCPEGMICGHGECICEPNCDLGERRCFGEELISCEQRSGCAGWSEPRSCGLHQHCTDGECRCLESCELGEQRCEADSVITCVEEAGCPIWGRPEACSGSQHCVENRCVCADICVEGELRCDGEAVQVCVNDNSSCPRWLPLMRCEELCLEGACVAHCENECEADEQRCQGEGISECELGVDGCYSWSEESPCPENHSCQEGECLPVCSPICSLGERRCEGEELSLCLLEEGCPVWRSSPCEWGGVCEGGRCFPPVDAGQSDSGAVDAGLSDAEPLNPDAEVIEPDAEQPSPDVEVLEDVEVIEPDAEQPSPDVEVIEVDAQTEDRGRPPQDLGQFRDIHIPDAGDQSRTDLSPDALEEGGGSSSGGCSLSAPASAPWFLLLLLPLLGRSRRWR